MIVIDASIVANALADDRSDGAAVRSRLLRERQLLAPDLLDVEVVSVLRRRWLAGDLSDERAMAAVDDLGDLPVDRVPMRLLARRAFDLRANVTPYDGVYIALAEALGCSLLTADKRLARAPGVHCTVELFGG